MQGKWRDLNYLQFRLTILYHPASFQFNSAIYGSKFMGNNQQIKQISSNNHINSQPRSFLLDLIKYFVNESHLFFDVLNSGENLLFCLQISINPVAKVILHQIELPIPILNIHFSQTCLATPRICLFPPVDKYTDFIRFTHHQPFCCLHLFLLLLVEIQLSQNLLPPHQICFQLHYFYFQSSFSFLYFDSLVFSSVCAGSLFLYLLFIFTYLILGSPFVILKLFVSDIKLFNCCLKLVNFYLKLPIPLALFFQPAIQLTLKSSVSSQIGFFVGLGRLLSSVGFFLSDIPIFIRIFHLVSYVQQGIPDGFDFGGIIFTRYHVSGLTIVFSVCKLVLVLKIRADIPIATAL